MRRSPNVCLKCQSKFSFSITRTLSNLVYTSSSSISCSTDEADIITTSLQLHLLIIQLHRRVSSVSVLSTLLISTCGASKRLASREKRKGGITFFKRCAVQKQNIKE